MPEYNGQGGQSSHSDQSSENSYISHTPQNVTCKSPFRVKDVPDVSDGQSVSVECEIERDSRQQNGKPGYITRRGRAVRPPAKLNDFVRY